MEKLRHPRGIIERRRLAAALAAIAEREPAPTPQRAAVLEALKSALAEGHAEIRRRFEDLTAPPEEEAPGEELATRADAGLFDGRAVAAANCYLMDQIVRTLHDFAMTHVYPLANPSAGERLSIVAVGGYGRGELAPHSDLDLLFLHPYKRTPHGEQVIEYMLYLLWDLRLKVGHAVRSVDECIRQALADMTIRTGLLEARYVWGEESLFPELRKRFWREVAEPTGLQFVEAKLAERDERHRRMGNSRYALEPNIKEGKGGLRDLHTLFWIGKYLYRVDDVAALVERGVLSATEAAKFKKAEHFLWTLRCHLHYVTDRPEERLSFDVQTELARRMGYTDHKGSKGVERLMKHYFLVAKTVGDLTRIFCAAIEAQHQRRPFLRLPQIGPLRRVVDGFPVEGGRVTVAGPEAFTKDPVNMLRLFDVAMRHDLDIHPAALRLVTRHIGLVDRKLQANPEANRLFLEMLTSPKDPELALRRINEAGILARFIPDFGRVVAQMQYDMYHHYTVDEHTLFAVGILRRVEEGQLRDDAPIASEVVHKVLSRRVLYLALFLHDIAKGRGGDHSTLGAGVAQKLGPRLGFSEEETETTAWLVQHHLLMSNTAFKRDIEDPKTISDFVAAVQSLERLRLLLVLTVADIRAVGPKVWNGWKAALLRQLYYRAEELITGGLITEGRETRVAVAIDALKGKLDGWSAAETEAHVARGYASYWLSFDTDTLARHARLVRDAEAAGRDLTIETRIDAWHAVTEVTIYTPDHAGLFSRLAGALALAGGNIVDAKIFTLANGMALDTFNLQDADGQAIEGEDKIARLVATVEKVLSARGAALPELDKPVSSIPSRLSVFKIAPRVLIDNRASATHTVIEVNGRDRRGLLHHLTRALTGLNLQISSAKISTYGLRAVDAFYVKDLFGLKIESETRLAAIRAKLIEVLQEGAAAAHAEADLLPARPPRRYAPHVTGEPDEDADAARYRRRLPAKAGAPAAE